jgi:hypothetical protein
VDAAPLAPKIALFDRVHHGRTSCKEARALLRLGQAVHGRLVRAERERLRAAARSLAGYRDLEALRNAIDDLKPRDRRDRAVVAKLRLRLSQDAASRSTNHRLLPAVLRAFAAELRASADALGREPVKLLSSRTLVASVRNSYRKARSLGRRLGLDDPGPDWHAWRKAVKALGYQCRAIQPEGGRRLDRLERLGRQLGREHDLSLLADRLQSEAHEPNPDDWLAEAGVLAGRRRRHWRRRSRHLGRRVFELKPGAFADRALIGTW